MKIRIFILFTALVFLYSCKPEVDDFNPTQGSADFSSFVVVGNSLSAGFADGALYKSGQENSFANILAQQLTHVGNSGDFNIPYIDTEDGVYPNLTSQGIYFSTKLVVGYATDCLGTTSLSPVPAIQNPNQQELLQQLTTSVADQGPFNNVAVPGIKVAHLFAQGLGALNPYYGRFASNPLTDRLIDEPAKVNPTFFSFWLGSNDVLDYAGTGGVNAITPLDGPVGVGFEATYNAALQTMVATAGKGVIINIPDILSSPYFKTIPYNAIVLTEQVQVDQLNTAYAPYNIAMETYGLPYRINFQLGPNPMIIFDVDMPLPPEFEQFKFRQITENELVLLTLPQDSLKCAQWGTAKPVPHQYVLTEKEVAVVRNTMNAFNSVIKKAADEYDLAFLDVYSIIKKAANQGIAADGITFTSAFITGNTFSLDGLHLTPQASAMVANYVIEAVNQKYNSSIPMVNVTEYSPIVLP